MESIHRRIFLILLLLPAILAWSPVFAKSTEKNVLLMWNTDESDPAYRKWQKMISGEFRRQGVKANFFNYYGTMGYSFEMEQRHRISSAVHSLDEQGMCPDLILAHGDYIHWQLLQNPDSLLSTIPMVCYGLKTPTLAPRMRSLLRKWDSPRKHIVEIHDTILLKESLDFMAFLESKRPVDYQTLFVPSYRFVGLLDNYRIWIDSVLLAGINVQMNALDTVNYLNCMQKVVPHELCLAKNRNGVRSLSMISFKDPGLCVPVPWQPVKWMPYRQKSPMRFVQIKHDDISRSLSEGPNLGPYYTMTPEDFLVNDSCVGGVFTVAEDMIRDAVSVGLSVIEGESPESFPRLMHTPGYHVNWNLMRTVGATPDQMPSNVHLYNTLYSDYYPNRARVIYVLSIFAFALLIAISIFFSLRNYRRQRRIRIMLNEHARNSIAARRLLNLAIETSGALMWEDNNESTVSSQLKVSDQWKTMLRAFYYQTEEGIYQVQLPGSLGNGEEHWYDLRMLIHKENGNLVRSGFLLNIDKVKQAQAMARESHQLLMDARAREGFISSMSHEIRTPLHAVVGFSMELARSDVQFSDEELQMFSGIIESNASQLKKIINDILLVTLMNNATVTAHCTPCSIASLLNSSLWPDAVTVLRNRRNVLSIQEGGQDVMVSADASMVPAVIENLLLNASFFSSEGSQIQISWKAHTDGRASISVTDEGTGISAPHCKMIFDRFFKVNSFTPGCGLGLFISREYMNRMGGEISVESTPGKGSTFTLTFCK
ncbi:MAG: HAMP domain-containing sensor histidine kinase [Bacteroidales bacterium]|nr:HAMP domain-containing sensor histidine kinase [Bacteroidales bacterium]